MSKQMQIADMMGQSVTVAMPLLPTSILKQNLRESQHSLDDFARSLGVDEFSIKALPTMHLGFLCCHLLVAQIEAREAFSRAKLAVLGENDFMCAPIVNTTTEPGCPDGFVEEQDRLYDERLNGSPFLE